MIQHARGITAGRAGPQNPSRAVSARSNRCSLRSAFTLVELLVVIVIIGMLAGIAMGALASAREAARVAKTKTTIAKLDRIIMAKYESYRTRRLPLSRAQLQLIAQTYGGVNPNTMARARMNVIRDLIRMEMPDRWNDVVNKDGSLRPPLVPQMQFPMLARRYWGVYDASSASAADKDLLGAAECLYQIVMAAPGSVEEFQDNEIGDADGDGLREFHDAWGKPILFIRWPAGFLSMNRGDSELQTLQSRDPFDPAGILGAAHSYALYPLVYSAGSDGIYDVNMGLKVSGGNNSATDSLYRYELYNLNVSPYVTDGSQPDPRLIGLPVEGEAVPSDGYYNHYDNIHNHHLEVN